MNEIKPAGKPLATSRKAQAKRDAIIRAATEIINDKSFAQATMTEIAASLRLRDATLYYYYSSKQVLGYACHLRSLNTFDRVPGGGGADRLVRGRPP